MSERLREALNDFVRGAIGFTLTLLAHIAEWRHRARVRRFAATQAALRRRYQIAADTPIRTYGPEVERDIDVRARALGGKALWAYTSGSTRAPKRLLYTRRRILATALIFAVSFARLFAGLRLPRKSLFVSTSIRTDGSLTSLLVRDERLPSRISLLQAPYRALGDARLRELADLYGDAAVRLWLLVLSNPGVLYATNPSTLAAFFSELEHHWDRSAALIRDVVAGALGSEARLNTIHRRLASRGARERLLRVAQASNYPGALAILPSLCAFACWDGGYVRGFLEDVRRHLPEVRVRHIPMYSMSTETIETIPHLFGGEVCFLPLAPGVLYEFLPADAPDDVPHLLAPSELEIGHAYALVVSDGFGLRRYQTEDLFLCKGFVDGLPDLRFLRRRGLAFSFTGEKITGEHLRAVYEQVHEAHAAALRGAFLTCIPSQPSGEAVPHYRLVVVGDAEVEVALLAAEADAALGEINAEYLAKRQSGRLGTMRGERMRIEVFAQKVSGHKVPGQWESQFKFLPLYPKLWETMENEAA